MQCRFISVLTLLIVVIQSMWPPLASCQDPLQGRVELRDRLPSLDATLAPGNTFDRQVADGLLSRGASSNNWYKIPGWLAGTWHSTQAMRTYSRDEQTGVTDETNRTYKTEGDEIYGNIRDSRGDIWQYGGGNYWTKTHFKYHDGYSYIASVEPVEVTQKAFIFRALLTQFKIDRKNNKIAEVYQKETLVHCKMTAENVMRQKHLQRLFNWEGAPTLSTTDIGNYKKITDFATRDQTPSGEDVHSLFSSFVKSHGISE